MQEPKGGAVPWLPPARRLQRPRSKTKISWQPRALRHHAHSPQPAVGKEGGVSPTRSAFSGGWLKGGGGVARRTRSIYGERRGEAPSNADSPAPRRATGGGMGQPAEEVGGAEELECGICCLPYDCCGRAPRRLGSARGSWKPSQCRHVLCSACVCRLAREGGWEEVTCPYCRTVTSLRERGNFLVAGVRRSSGYGRRRLVLPPIDTELWQRVVLAERERQEAECPADGAPNEEQDGEARDEAGQWRLWRALKRVLKGGTGRSAHAPTRSRSAPARGSQPMNPYAPDMKDLALMTCCVI